MKLSIKSLVFFLAISLSVVKGFGQVNYASNVVIVADEKRLFINYEINDNDETANYKVAISLTYENKEIKLQNVKLYGDFGDVLSPGKKLVYWDYAGDFDKDINKVVVTVTAFKNIAPEQLSTSVDPSLRHKRYKMVWMGVGVVSLGTGIYSCTKAKSLYKEYKTATDNPTDLHRKIETYDIIAPVAFGISALSAVQVYIQHKKQSQSTSTLNVRIAPIDQGGMVHITYTF